MLEKLNLCRCFFCVQSVFIVSSKLKAFNKFKPGNFPRVVPFHKTGKMFWFSMGIQMYMVYFKT